MKSQEQSPQNRFFLLSWLVLPLILIWMIASFFIGINRQPVWAQPQNQQKCANQVIPSQIYKWQGTGLITLWFDDGWQSQYSTAEPVLEENKIKAALSIITGSVNGDHYLSWAQIKLLQYRGWEITSHSVNHICEKEKLDYKKIDEELINSKNKLESEGLIIENYTTPCGTNVELFVQQAKNYYQSLRTSFTGLNPLPVTNPYQLNIVAISQSTKPEDINNRIEQAKLEKKWLILVFHQVDDSQAEYSVTPENFNKIVNQVIESKLPVVLPSQVLSMVVEK